MGARRYSVVWTESARSALDDIIAYIPQDSMDRAVRVLQKALETAATLDHLPERGRTVHNAQIRELFVFDYRLLYEIVGERVAIVAFLHGARDFATWRREQP